MASFSSDEERYEVDHILGSRKKGRSVEYLVKWKGFDSDEESWEPAKTLRKTASDAIEHFEKKQLTKSPSRKKSQQTMEEVSSKSATGGHTMSKRTTVTTTETRSVLGQMSDSESESPRLSQRTTTTRTEHRRSSDSSSRLGGAADNLDIDLSRDWPVMVQLLCFLVIFLTFVFHQ